MNGYVFGLLISMLAIVVILVIMAATMYADDENSGTRNSYLIGAITVSAVTMIGLFATQFNTMRSYVQKKTKKYTAGRASTQKIND
jgi:Na+/melibiose symporter-like transporter